MRSFKCSIDTFPLVCLVICILICCTVLAAGFPVHACCFGALVALSYANVPRTIRVDDNAISISGVIPRIYLFSSIASITPVVSMQSEFFGAWGGYSALSFSYVGRNFARGIRNDSGTAYFYCTQRKNFVVITTTDGNSIVISPNDPDALIADIRSRHPNLISKHSL